MSGFNPEKPKENITPPQEKIPEEFDIGFQTEGYYEPNEDVIFVNSDMGFFGVFDGAGGLAAGEKASRAAMDCIAKKARDKLVEGLSFEETKAKLSQIFSEADKRVSSLAVGENKGMMTTACAVKIWEGSKGEKKAIVANVGDSRAYILHNNGWLELVTLDDGMIRKGIPNEQKARLMQDKLNNVVSEEELSSDLERVCFAQRHLISQALGKGNVVPRIHSAYVAEGGKIIITSDGIHDNLTDKEIAEIARASNGSQSVAEELIRRACERSKEDHPRAKPDDMSAIVVGIPVSLEQWHEGNPVTVRRSSGQIESDWTVESFDKKSGIVTVAKQDIEDGKTLRKKLLASELAKLNPKEKRK